MLDEGVRGRGLRIVLSGSLLEGTPWRWGGGGGGRDGGGRGGREGEGGKGGRGKGRGGGRRYMIWMSKYCHCGFVKPCGAFNVRF